MNSAAAKWENEQEFEAPATLAEFRRLLGVIGEELKEYQVWPVGRTL